jgi:PAS domain S-box-containing protein
MPKRSNLFSRPPLNPLTIALGYALVGSAWIVFSDRILGFLSADLSVAHVTRIQSIKGVLYIALTAGFIYLVTSRAIAHAVASQVELEEVKTRYLRLFEKTGAIVLVVEGKSLTIVDANRAAERFYGWSREELVGRPIKDIEVEDSPAVHAATTSRPEDHPFTDSRHRLASGEERDVMVNVTPVVAEGQPLLFLLIHDGTEQRRLERQLRQAQKMEAVGQLTGGIAHDLNNVLTVVLADADLIAAELPHTSADIREDLDDLRAAARRGASMIRKLLSFSRTANLRITTLDLGQAIEDLMPAIRRLLPENIRVDAKTLDAGRVKADPGALEQIVLNLVTNARDAMPGGGWIFLETGAATLNPTVEHPWVRSGTYAYVRATDTGVGMDARTQAKLFEPFFTTKSPTEGAGLGMAMVYGLVKQHDGFVLVSSEPGKGTTVTVYLPPAPKLDRHDPAADPAVPPGAERGAGGETILLVEDEDALRRAGERILERLGYVVLSADNGQRGLEILDEKGDDIDLVISDVVMPRVGGRALYEAARVRRKDIRFLFTSGYTATGSGEAAPLPDVPFIQKPWTVDELGKKVREVLSQKP